jgi:hypothetical protein
MQKAIRVACTFYIDETQQLALQVHLKKAMWRTTAQAFRELLEKEGNEIIQDAFVKLYPNEEFISYTKEDNYTLADQEAELKNLDTEPIVERKVDLRKGKVA